MKCRLLTIAVIAFSLVISGCATRTPMAFQDDAERLTEKSKPVYLMATTIRNDYKVSYQPRLAVLYVEKPDAKDAADRLNFTMDSKANHAYWPQGGNSYLLRLALEPGRYELRGMLSTVNSFPIVGSFFTPLHMPLEVKEPGVYYLGRVTATVRERQGDEFKAGPSIPLIDQAVAGASGGTFDVAITDEFAVDEEVFRNKFPALQGVEIRKAILPAFDRAKAQKWWEDN